MKFAVDAHAIGRHLTGNEVYVRSLLGGFAALGREDEFVAYTSSDDAERWIPARFKHRHVSANPFWRLGFDLAMKVRQDRPDLLHVQYTGPVGCPVPLVVSVHDVSFLEHPEYFPRWRAIQLRATVRHTVMQAARVLTVSEFSRTSILKGYPQLDPDNVVVLPNAASDEFHPLSREQARAGVQAKFGYSKPFILMVGDLQPRKNHVGLIAAFAGLVQEFPQLRHDLVFAGKETWHAAQVKAAVAASGVAERIHFAGFVDDADLVNLYNACEIFVFPSHYEGFGIPILEAMACGRAVACSAGSAMTEVADGAGLLFNQESKAEIVRTMADLLLDGELRARMERLGLQRAAHFSWKRTAELTLAVYHRVAEARRSLAHVPAAAPQR